MRNKQLKETIFKLTKGIFHTLEDFLLFYFLMMESQIGKSKTSSGVWQAFYEAEEEFKKYKQDTFKRSYYKAKRKNFVQISQKDGQFAMQITKAGREKLDNLLPKYNEKRLWDKKLYLVTYDIAEKRKQDRDKLRGMIKQLGMGMLQESVWITPYNPKEILRQFLDDHYLTGAVIVSDLGEDGAIGEEDIKSLVCRVYKLDQLNQRYEDFLLKLNQNEDNPWLRLDYLSILKDDPQLPFALLPEGFCGKKAYEFFKTYTTD